MTSSQQDYSANESSLFKDTVKTARMQEDQVGTMLVTHLKPMAVLGLYFHE